MSQAALAAACGLSQGAIANYENKNRRTAKEIFRIAETLGVNPVWLAMGTGPMEAAPSSPGSQATYQVSDHGSSQGRGLWPFSSVSSEQYWSLPPGERSLIENTVASLIQSLQDKSSAP